MNRELKDSGVEWIGEIPLNWKLAPIKYLASYNDEILSENTDSNYEFDYIEIGSVEYGKGITQVEHLKFENAPSRARRIVRPNDIIVSTVRTYLRAIATVQDSDKVQIASTGFVVIRAREINPGYLRYSLLSESFISMVEAYSTGISYPAINSSVVVGFKIPVPCAQEQKRIAIFLTKQCGELDNILAKTRASIEEYKKLKQAVIAQAVTKGLNSNVKMKDSGIEWIGNIPSTWKVSKLKHHLRRYEPKNPGNVIVLSLYRDLGVIPKDSRSDNHNVTSEDTSNYKYVKPGDFVVNKMKAWQGSVAVSEYEGIVSPAYFVYQFTDDVYLKKYFHYLLRSCYKNEFRRLSGGIRIGQWDLSSNALDNISIIIPSVSEQQEIANYLDEKCTEIDNLIARKEKYFTEIENYKKSLIYEYVTGKKEVPETWA